MRRVIKIYDTTLRDGTQGEGVSFSMEDKVRLATRLDALARSADAEAMRLDESEAPLREIARQKQEAETTRASQEKARVTNKATFRP